MNINMNMNKDTKDIIKWIIIGACTLGGGSHLKNFADSHADEIKEFAKVLFDPLIAETRQIRFNQQTVIYNQHIDQYQKDGMTLDEAIEQVNKDTYGH